jgi:hypothetical protein
LIVVVGVIAFVSRRRRQDEAETFISSTAVEPRPQMAVTPFDTTLAGATPRETGHPVWTMSNGLFSKSDPTLSRLQNAASTPVGLTDKELARLRSAPMLSPPTHPHSSSSGSQPASPPIISTTDQSGATPTPNTRILQTEMETLRREMQPLLAHAERFEAPPSYGDGEDG